MTLLFNQLEDGVMTQMTKAWKNHLMPLMLTQNLQILIHLDHRSHHRGLYTQNLKMVSRVSILSTEGKAKRSNTKRCQSSRDPLFLFWLPLYICMAVSVWASSRTCIWQECQMIASLARRSALPVRHSAFTFVPDAVTGKRLHKCLCIANACWAKSFCLAPCMVYA